MKKILLSLIFLLFNSSCSFISAYQDKPKISKSYFDYVPARDMPTIPGAISIIYKNSYKFKVLKDKNVVESEDKSAEQLINNILKKYNVKSVSDMAYSGLSEDKINEDEKVASDHYDTEVPNRHSIQTYTFSTDSNTKQIAEELRKLQFVVTAYPSLLLSF